MPKAIVLAGGGARGSYHIGAWQALMEMGYKPDIVTGTSVGSLNGALVALDAFDTAKSMWLSIAERDVMDIPQKVISKETLEFVKDFATKGGISLEPLEKMITRFVDEDMLRKSHCRYGLVTVNVDTLKPLELALEDIPQGKLVDYMLASSGCFPILRSRTIDGHKYIDGGYYDNLPSNLAIKMGADEIVAVDLDCFGVNRPVKDKNVKITQIKSWHDLGGFLDFNPQNAQRNMALGYLDTYKAFGKLEGKAYAFPKGETDRMYWEFGEKFMELCEHLYKIHPALKLSAEVYMHAERKNPKTINDKFIAVIEGAMQAADLSVKELYTTEKLKAALAASAVKPIFDSADSIANDSPKAVITASLGAADIKKVYYALLKNFV